MGGLACWLARRCQLGDATRARIDNGLVDGARRCRARIASCSGRRARVHAKAIPGGKWCRVTPWHGSGGGGGRAVGARRLRCLLEGRAGRVSRKKLLSSPSHVGDLALRHARAEVPSHQRAKSALGLMWPGLKDRKESTRVVLPVKNERDLGLFGFCFLEKSLASGESRHACLSLAPTQHPHLGLYLARRDPP